MALKINKKQEKKIIKKYALGLSTFPFSKNGNTDINYETWINSIDYERKRFRKIVNIKKRKLLTLEAISYIEEEVLRNAWRKYWYKLYDKLSQEKQN